MTTVSRRNGTIRALILTLLGIILASSTPAAAQSGPNYMMQCGCPVQWSADWDGTGVFDTGESLDLIVLVNDTGVLLMHEIPASAGDLYTLADARSDSLDDAGWILDLEEVVIEEGPDHVVIGRLWDGPGGEVMISVQYVQVWETNFLLSIEFVAPELDFADLWDELGAVTVVSRPVLNEFDAEEILDALGM